MFDRAHLGHDRFAVVGHDRGALVAFRTAMDHPRIVSHLVVMDGLPVIENLERTDATFAQAYWHWWFLGQTDKPAERMINADPDAWYSTPEPACIGDGNHADLWAALHNPAVIHGMCEDYRAGLTIDVEHERADKAAGRRVRCPIFPVVFWPRICDGPNACHRETRRSIYNYHRARYCWGDATHNTDP